MSSRSIAPAGRNAGLDVLVAGTASDAHTWNLIFLDCFLTEHGHRVVNIGPCVPDELLVARCRTDRPDLVVLSSVNGHGFTDGLRVVTHFCAQPDLAGIPVVIGGKLGIEGGPDPLRAARLLGAGAAAVFDDGDLAAFEKYLTTVEPGLSQAAS
ncbi:MAG TPA: cobalamin-dependent protein [Pseudonocardiaceae bacterium]|nr:cobalamin-dependent protein [Pseudonocardiaceae bacterium]